MSETPPIADWIAVDWGTTNLRAFAMRGDRALASAQSASGMGALARDEFEGALLSLIEPWLPADRVTDVVCCGMVGSRQGWVEAGYEAVPGPPRRDVPMARAKVSDRRLRVHVLHGLKQAEPADVMRGEETQIAGFLTREPGFSGTLCLPGTHSKWVRIENGTVRHFTTYLTGELFALIGGQSVLRHTIADGGWSEEAFLAALKEVQDKPAALSAALFALRAGALLGTLGPVDARSRLSGLLIGSELAGAADDWQHDNLVLIGAAAALGPYATALAALGARPRTADVTEMTLAGLSAAYRALHSERVHS